ncbi:MAG TPA: secretin N-terminal domain-containing protein, partial [Pirellulales bacterium]|nr:secretin N-terminal domain-containing protein [Pirellulales bacterium]
KNNEDEPSTASEAAGDGAARQTEAEQPAETRPGDDAPGKADEAPAAAKEADATAAAEDKAPPAKKPESSQTPETDRKLPDDADEAAPAPGEMKRPAPSTNQPGGDFRRGDELGGAEMQPLDEPQQERELPRAAHAPIKIMVGPYGITMSSSDTEALDRLEDLLSDLMPPRIAYKVFKLKNTYAKDVVYLLEDVFKEDDGSSSKANIFDSFWNGRSSQPESSRSTLGKRRPLKFIPDAVTNTILVQGADAAQLAEIESLIDLYDQHETPDSNSVRRTQLVALRYAKATEVTEIIKDVYRDLLSPNDKALQKGMQPQPQQQQQQRDGGFYSAMFSYLSDDPEKAQNIPRFKGMLSIGIDERSNSLAVSAPQLLLADVLEMVNQLDLAAKPTRQVVRVLKLNQPGALDHIQRAFGAQANEPAKPSAPQPGEGPEQGLNQNQGRQRGMGQGRNGAFGDQN